MRRSWWCGVVVGIAAVCAGGCAATDEDGPCSRDGGTSLCASGTPGGACDEVTWLPVCRGGAWRCEARPPYTRAIFASGCASFGPEKPDGGR